MLRQVLTMQGSYTHFAVLNLKKLRVLVIGNKRKSFGGPLHPMEMMITRCLQRMGAWVELSRSIVQAECPDFQIFYAFSVFNLSKKKKMISRDSISIEEFRETCFQRIAQYRKFDVDKFKTQFNSFEDRARHIHVSTGCPYVEAWSRAIMEAKRHDRGNRYPSDLMVTSMKLYRIAAPVTGGVEQNFSTNKWLLGDRRLGMIEQRETAVIKITHDRPNYDEAQVVGMAREVFSYHYGNCRRQEEEERITVGTRRTAAGSSSDKPSRADFLRRRREESAALLNESFEDVEPVDVSVAFSEKHKAEKKFQEDKLRSRKVEAFRAGSLLPCEVDDKFLDEVAASNLATEAAAKARDVATKRKRAKTHAELYLHPSDQRCCPDCTAPRMSPELSIVSSSRIFSHLAPRAKSNPGVHML